LNLIGNIYIDGFANTESLDGKSHNINNLSFGGFSNIFNQSFITKHIEFFKKLKVHCITTHSIFEKWEGKLNKTVKFNIHHYNYQELPPVAFIIESQGKRSSFVMFDNPIKIKEFNFDNNDNLIFYGDKLSIENAKLSKGKFFIDTAGNNYKDLLLPNNQYPKGSIISISSEYLTKELEKRYRNDLEFIIVSHNPKCTKIYSNSEIKTIENNYYVDSNQKSFQVTGLGDKYFALISFYNSHYKYSLEKAVEISQKDIFELIKS